MPHPSSAETMARAATPNRLRPTALAGFASHLCDIEIALQPVGDRRVDLLHGEADEAEPRDEPVTERPLPDLRIHFQPSVSFAARG